MGDYDLEARVVLVQMLAAPEVTEKHDADFLGAAYGYENLF